MAAYACTCTEWLEESGRAWEATHFLPSPMRCPLYWREAYTCTSNSQRLFHKFQWQMHWPSTADEALPFYFGHLPTKERKRTQLEGSGLPLPSTVHNMTKPAHSLPEKGTARSILFGSLSLSQAGELSPFLRYVEAPIPGLVPQKKQAQLPAHKHALRRIIEAINVCGRMVSLKGES